MSTNKEKVLQIAYNEVGYLEKKSNAYLDDKTANAGYNNYTKYGRDMHAIFPSVMDFPAPYCDAFVDWCFYKAYGIANAKGLIGGDFNDYTVASAQLYKNKGAYHKNNPQPGDQIFFHNGTRIYHTGLVTKVENGKVYTIEGNTSGGSEVEANGGGVFEKTYQLDYARIDGYGRPAYSKQTFKPSWVHDGKNWYYRIAEGKNAKGWKLINHHWYLFAEDGKMLTGWQSKNGQLFYLEESGDYQGACWHESDGHNGALERWYVE